MADIYSRFTDKFVSAAYIERKQMINRLSNKLKWHYIYDYVCRTNTYSINSEPYNIYEVMKRLKALNNTEIDDALN